MPTHDERMRRETVAKWHGEVRQPTHNLRADRCASGPARVRVRAGNSRDRGQVCARGQAETLEGLRKGLWVA